MQPNEPTTTPIESDLPLDIGHNEVIDALENGTATTLSNTITDFITYHGAWWIADPHGWIRITDNTIVARLERHAAWAQISTDAV